MCQCDHLGERHDPGTRALRTGSEPGTGSWARLWSRQESGRGLYERGAQWSPPCHWVCQASVTARELGEDNEIDANLLNELRIDGQHRESDGDAGPPRWVWPVLALVVLAALLAGAAWWYFVARPIAVQTAAAVAPGVGGAPGAVLQATGYITARRQATVSTQITGTLTQVLIEEGDRVQKGQ